MITHIYGIRDMLVGEFVSVIEVHNEGDFLRAIYGEATRPGSKLNLYKADHDLWHLASVETKTGFVKPENAFISTVIDVINSFNLKINSTKPVPIEDEVKPAPIEDEVKPAPIEDEVNVDEKEVTQ